MPSRFPGIDPYLEAQHYWPDFHNCLITYCRDALVDQLPDQYLIRIEERLHLVERDPEDIRLMRPDLLIERSSAFASFERATTVLEVEPTTIPVAILEEVREVYLEILHRPDRTLVAVVELLSPDNKVEPGYGQYLTKRNELLRGLAHIVELDFLVRGRRLPMARPLPPGDFYAIVVRGDRRPDSDVYAWSIRQPLSKIKIPLLAPDPDVILDLAALYNTTYDRGRYVRSIDYTKPLSIGLAAEDRAWAEALVRSEAP
jgi:hypothetical protein